MKFVFLLAATFLFAIGSRGQKTEKPPLHGRHWIAITGKPLAAEAGARIFQQGGNAVDAACAMLGAVCTMWTVLSWGGETQAILYNPHTGKVFSVNALGFAPAGATPEFFRSRGYYFPPEYGPLAAVTPGTPGGLCFLLAEYGTMSLGQVLAPAMELAAGYPIDAQIANMMQRNADTIRRWPYSREVFFTHPGAKREAPEPGEIFVQKDLLATLQKMIDAESAALAAGKSRKDAIYAAYDRFYKGDIAREFVRGCREQGGLITEADLAGWKPQVEEPLHTVYKGIEVYKLQSWSQGPMMLECLNMLENFDLASMGYNSAAYLNTIAQALNLAFADRDFYYGDPAFPPEEPIRGLLSKAYAKQRAALIDPKRTDLFTAPGDPYPFEGRTNPYKTLLKERAARTEAAGDAAQAADLQDWNRRLWLGTTSIEAADSSGWVVSVTPSGGWLPACIAGHTGVGMSQRMQSFVIDSTIDPFNVVAPHKRPRVTLTPSLAMKDGKPFLAFAVQGGDTQDQNLLQLFLNIVEFHMTVQQATEAANLNTNQLWLSLGGSRMTDRMPRPGSILLARSTPDSVRTALQNMGYKPTFAERTSGPLNAIWFDRAHGSFWGGSSNYGEDYGIAW